MPEGIYADFREAVSNWRNQGFLKQELRFPFVGMEVSPEQDYSNPDGFLPAAYRRRLEQPLAEAA